VSRVDGASFLASNADAEHNPGSQLLVEREVFARHDLLPRPHLVQAKQAPADALHVAMLLLVVHDSRVHRVAVNLHLDSSLASMHHSLPFYHLKRGEFPFPSVYGNPTMQNCLSEAPGILRIRYTVALIFERETLKQL